MLDRRFLAAEGCCMNVSEPVRHSQGAFVRSHVGQCARATVAHSQALPFQGQACLSLPLLRERRRHYLPSDRQHHRGPTLALAALCRVRTGLLSCWLSSLKPPLCSTSITAASPLYGSRETRQRHFADPGCCPGSSLDSATAQAIDSSVSVAAGCLEDELSYFGFRCLRRRRSRPRRCRSRSRVHWRCYRRRFHSNH